MDVADDAAAAVTTHPVIHHHSVADTNDEESDRINPSIMMMDDDDETTSSTRSSFNPSIPKQPQLHQCPAVKMVDTLYDNNNYEEEQQRRKHATRFFAKHVKWSLTGGGRWVKQQQQATEDSGQHRGPSFDASPTMIPRQQYKFEDEVAKVGREASSILLPPTRRRAVQRRIEDTTEYGNGEDISSSLPSNNNRHRGSGGGGRRRSIGKTLSSSASSSPRKSIGGYETPLAVAMEMSSPKELLRRWTNDFDACPPYLGEENHPLHDMQYSPFTENDRQWKRIIKKAPNFNSGHRLRRRSSVASRRSSISSAGGSLSDCEVDTFDDECADLDEVMNSLCCQSDPEHDGWSLCLARRSTSGRRHQPNNAS
ncbi:hypothetical protein FOZ60_017251 [Perkinsus olseni]|uniref:Uncharacterized protein n=1 Tax=Perkinsus olseni TaxID=32597 RepID=A0A7J6P582_PEROL|nr:hypothetical protein FOZ60_017251 [Perkinsus olseni]